MRDSRTHVWFWCSEASGLIHSGDSQNARSSSSSRHESTNCCEGHAGRSQSALPPTPTSASWLNTVEGFFAKLTRRRLQRGIFRSVDELKHAINRFIAETNGYPKPFVWTADPRRVLAAVKRGKQA
jgi:hypothetical protein